ncbi:helix-turn-helix domain-containing protein [Paenibacillus antarcticus]|jgi:transcriptional regulator with XRE-family HTH domain
MTKKLFCEELGISTGNLGDWKRGKSTPSTNKLVEIGAYFNTSLDWLILGKESKNELLKEEREQYIIDTLQPETFKLSKREIDFIKEYIKFTDYRRNRQLE